MIQTGPLEMNELLLLITLVMGTKSLSESLWFQIVQFAISTPSIIVQRPSLSGVASQLFEVVFYRSF